MLEECCSRGWAGISADGEFWSTQSAGTKHLVLGRGEAGQRRVLRSNFAYPAIKYEFSFTVGTAIKSVPANSSPGKWRLTWSWTGLFWFCYWTQVHMPNAQWSQTNRNISVGSRGRSVAGPSKDSGGCAPKRGSSLTVLSGRSFYVQNWGVGGGLPVRDSVLIGWWWDNRAGFKASWSHLPPPGRGPQFPQESPEVLSQCCFMRSQDPTPQLHYCFLIASPFFTLSPFY